MTEQASMRLGRVVQQLRSFAELHASELEALALELEIDRPELAAKVRAFRDIQRDETMLVVDEVEDIQRGLTPEEASEAPTGEEWRASPKRAEWLAQQKAPRTRRELLRGSRASDE
jgi:hypothetical protein